jgi:NAD kinase
MLPIMPHLSANYCLVLPPEVAVRLGVQAVHPATISIDGHINIMAKSNAMVTIKRSKYTIRFLRIHPESTFYSSLEKRLKGKC